ncbi:MAG TPA: DMT family transporter [Mycobacteriales bacterium]|nr:DMT family transporter [Mycobacteriales bacterium]
MAVVLGLLAALAYGASDFLGGLVTKRAAVWPVVCWAQLAALAAVACALPAMPGQLTWSVAGWGLLAGAGTTVGSLLLYRGLSAGRMNVVAPLSGVIAAALPVLVGLLTGDRPGVLALIGVGLALPAIVLVSLVSSPHAPARPSGAPYGIGAGLGFAALFIALERPGDAAGVWPLLSAEVVAVLLVATLTLARRRSLLLRTVAETGGAALVGILGAAATLLYLVATRHGLLSVVAVLVSLYPALTVILAAILLRERSTRIQILGMLGAALAVGLIAAG